MTHMPFFHKTLFADVSVGQITGQITCFLCTNHHQPEAVIFSQKKSEMLHYNPTNVEIQGVPAHTYEVSK
jgi:hypothetical protein